MIKMGKHQLNRETLFTLYYTFIYPYLTYCSIVWSNTWKIYLNKLHLLQKRVIRIIYNVGYRDSTVELLIKAKLINIYDLNLSSICMLMFKYRIVLITTTNIELFVQGEIQYSHIIQGQVQCMTLLNVEPKLVRKQLFTHEPANYINQLLQNQLFNMIDSFNIAMFKCRL